jgi:hypothetical protein
LLLSISSCKCEIRFNRRDTRLQLEINGNGSHKNRFQLIVVYSIVYCKPDLRQIPYFRSGNLGIVVGLRPWEYGYS